MLKKIVNYFQGALEELKKVVWPSRQEVISHTIIVVLAIIVALAIIALLDLGLSNLIQILIYN